MNNETEKNTCLKLSRIQQRYSSMEQDKLRPHILGWKGIPFTPNHLQGYHRFHPHEPLVHKLHHAESYVFGHKIHTRALRSSTIQKHGPKWQLWWSIHQWTNVRGEKRILQILHLSDNATIVKKWWNSKSKTPTFYDSSISRWPTTPANTNEPFVYITFLLLLYLSFLCVKLLWLTQVIQFLQVNT